MKNPLNFVGRKSSSFCILVMSGLFLVGCEKDDEVTLEPGDGAGEVSVQFQTVTPAASDFKAVSEEKEGTASIIEGTNGSLHINEIFFIVDDFELEGDDLGETDDDSDMEGDDNEFEDGLFFVDLPLDGSPIQVATSDIQEGVYNTFEFEIDDLDMDDEEDSAEQAEKEALMGVIQATFPEWPESASMVISGTFMSADGEEVPFTTFADAEVSIENDLTPPLEITGEAVSGKMLSVKISPENWFKKSDGTVINLSDYDYATTSELLEFEVEMENGFEEVEVEED